MVRMILSLMLALLVATGVAFAKEGNKKGGNAKPKKTVEQVFNAKDTDKDGKLSLDEFKGKVKDSDKLAKLEKVFKALDKDADGFLTLEEFKTHAKGAQGKHGGNKQPKE